jgi:ribonuclease G
MKKIFINTEDFHTRVAITEENKLVNYFIEKNIFARAGNIYKGKVTKTVSNMNFVFVDIGDSKPAFLSETEYFDFSGVEIAEIFNNGTGPEEGGKPQPPEITFEKGQEIIAQVIKEPYATKGARLTTNVMLPGYYVVFCPCYDFIGVSKKISSEEDRRRLKAMAREIKKENNITEGLILRTQSVNAPKEELEKELKAFSAMWQEIKNRFKSKKAPFMLREEQSVHIKVLRELMDENVSEIVADDRRVFDEAQKYLSEVDRKQVRLEFYDGVEPLFESYGFANQVEALNNSIVPFKKGGYIKIDHTEALTVFDINSGKFKGVEDVENSLLLLNENAGREIARQIIARNIGGLIVIDFVDMKKEENNAHIKEVMDRELAKSKMYFKTTPISEFGLMEITRKRDTKKIEDVHFEECSACRGRGKVETQDNICIKKLEQLKYMCRREKGKTVVLEVSKESRQLIEKEYREILKDYQKRYNKKIILKKIENSGAPFGGGKSGGRQ